MNNMPWSKVVDDLIDAYGQGPLVISRSNLTNPSTTTLEYSSDPGNSFYSVEGVVMPKGNYTSIQMPALGTVDNILQVYIKAKQVNGEDYTPMIGDVVNDRIQDYTILSINAFKPNGVFCGYVLEVSV